MDYIAHIVAPYLHPRDCRALVVAWPKNHRGHDDLTRRVYNDLILRVGLPRPSIGCSSREAYYHLVYGKYCDFCYLPLEAANSTSCASYFLCNACIDLWIHLGDRLNGIDHDLDVLRAISDPLSVKLQRLLHGSLWVRKKELLTIIEPLKRLTEREVYVHKSRLLWKFRGQVYEKRVHTVFSDELRRFGLSSVSLGNLEEDPIGCVFSCSALIQAYTATQDMLEALVAFDNIPQRSIRDIVRMQLQRKSITGEGPLHDLAASRPCWEGSCSATSCVLGAKVCSQMASMREQPIPTNAAVAPKRSTEHRSLKAARRRKRLRCVA
ncbi:hypothetical protein FOL46_005410 [Perkinsus olseni]|uniref:Uncharacterized protein n=1 Tax=Perkinsus olseni TaxID=32597 RepID=A0A7J6LSH9_PEROL|nr:hypothetical protein FOL46_005410 [Perkinsus olseni]